MSDYKFVARKLTLGITQMDDSGQPSVQNVGEFVDYLNEMYLSQGYKILQADTVHFVPDTEQGSPPTYYVVYHMLKESASK